MIKALAEIGFTLNEAKAYIALTNSTPMNGYEIAKQAQISRSMVYEVISRLISKKAIVVVGENPTNYIAVHYKELIQNYQEDQKVKIDKIERLFKEFTEQRQDSEYVLNLPNHQILISETKNAIALAQKEIFISIWDQELNEYIKELSEAESRGIDIRIFSFNKLSTDIGKHYTYEIPDMDEIFLRRRSVFVIDKEKLFIGEWNNSQSELSISTKNQMLINLAVDMMMLDVMMFYAMLTKAGFVPGMSRQEYHDRLSIFFEDVSQEAMQPKYNDKKNSGGSNS